ncbi:hypothetical protein [Hydrogenivirga sp. 128-5-R1-1]|uniref:hypothetical protein n=1 Tax=Hydrogenivirga sp. 128-5-R1-1 TaxID=392423 RepID=UPI00015EF78F|nr:hypothetical protein [Hydrogenivirga sp. 128-5-R1-1]EDP75632.1 hypothetical protein HG1285_16750 [Hydrogenivirga sp. 128-5-R1-1]
MEYLPEAEWFKHNELVMDVMTPGFYDEVAKRLIEPAKVKVGAGTRELRWKFLLNYGNVPGVEYNLVLIKSPQELYEIFGVDGLEGVKGVLKKETEEWSGEEGEKKMAIAYIDNINDDCVAVKLTDMMGRYFAGVFVRDWELVRQLGSYDAVLGILERKSKEKGRTYEEQTVELILGGWGDLLASGFYYEQSQVL